MKSGIENVKYWRRASKDVSIWNCLSIWAEIGGVSVLMSYDTVNGLMYNKQNSITMVTKVNQMLNNVTNNFKNICHLGSFRGENMATEFC